MKEIDVAWFAGLMEGEGSFLKRRRWGMVLAIVMTDRDVLERVQQLFGGHLYDLKTRQSHWKPSYMWRLTIAAEAAHLSKLILPYMGVRRAEAIGALLNRYEEGRHHKKMIRQRQQKIRRLGATGQYKHCEIAQMVGVGRSYVSHLMRTA